MARLKSGLIADDEGIVRCWWAGTDPLYRAYHDTEWGFPVRDDRRLFEKICLEGFQAGLAWITILRKREHFRAAFRDFDMEAVARLNRRSVDRLLRDPGIVRHRGPAIWGSTEKLIPRVRNKPVASHRADPFQRGTWMAFVWAF